MKPVTTSVLDRFQECYQTLSVDRFVVISRIDWHFSGTSHWVCGLYRSEAKIPDSHGSLLTVAVESSILECSNRQGEMIEMLQQAVEEAVA